MTGTEMRLLNRDIFIEFGCPEIFVFEAAKQLYKIAGLFGQNFLGLPCPE